MLTNSGTSPASVSLSGLMAVLLRHARTLVLVPVGIAAAVLGYDAAFGGKRYTAQAKLVPQSPHGATTSQFAGLASQFGVNVRSGGREESPEFYAQLLRTHDMLRAVALTPVAIADRPAAPVQDLLGIDAPTAEARTTSAVNRLTTQVSAQVDAPSGIVTLRTTASTPALAEAINQRLLELVDEFNQNKRKLQAATERDFVAGQLEEAQAAMRAAEDRLTAFLGSNRDISAPHLAREHRRLERDLSLRQQVHASLAQAYEQARIDVVRTTPAVTIIDAPAGSARRTDMRMLQLGLLSLVSGFFFALAIVLTREHAAREARLHPDDFEQMRQEWAPFRSWMPLSRKAADSAVATRVGKQ